MIALPTIVSVGLCVVEQCLYHLWHTDGSRLLYVREWIDDVACVGLSGIDKVDGRVGWCVCSEHGCRIDGQRSAYDDEYVGLANLLDRRFENRPILEKKYDKRS